MRLKIAAALLIVSALALSGCESKQAKVMRLEKIANDLETQYRKECFDPSKPESADGVHNALHGTASSAQQQAALLKQQRDEEAHIASAHCQDLAARKTVAGQQWGAALNEAAR